MVDRAKSGPPSVLMILDERSEAESIAFALRQKELHVDVVGVPERAAVD